MFSAGDTLAGSRYGAAMAAAATPQPQSTTPVTDLSMHVGGATSNSNSTAAVASKTLLYYQAAIVLGAIALLWVMGGIVFKSARQ